MVLFLYIIAALTLLGLIGDKETSNKGYYTVVLVVSILAISIMYALAY